MNYSESAADPSAALCFAYLRKSREDYDREKSARARGETYDTLERHERLVRAMAAENGHTLSHIYREVVSGETIKDRPEATAMLDAVAHNLWDYCYVVEASRLGRGGGADQERIINAFRYTGTWILSDGKDYDPNSDKDMQQLKNDLRSSEDEYESINRRLTRGKYSAARDGRWLATGRAPCGWRAVRIKGVWQLEPDPESHGHMLRIYDLMEAGLGFAAIARIYNEEGVPTPRGGKRWTAASVRAIAMNRVNCGYVVYGARKTIKVLDTETYAARKTNVVNDDPLIERGLHYGTGGISEERFERLTSSHREASRQRKGLKLKNPLASILRCGKCGYAMSYHIMNCKAEKRTYYYSHKHRRDALRPCEGCRGVKASMVMDSLIEALKAICNDVSLSLGDDGGMAEHQRHLDAIRAELAKQEETRSRVMDAYESGAYTVKELKERKDGIDNRIKELQKALRESAPPSYSEETIVSIHECIDALSGDASPQSVNDLLRAIIDHIDYYDDSTEWGKHDIRLEVFLR